MKILIINGPNLNLLGKRENDIYGELTLEEINLRIKEAFKHCSIAIDFYQSNHEGEIITKIQNANSEFNAIVINPAAYSHYSIGILDAIKAISIDVIEVHISNIYAREQYRRTSVISEACVGVISGLGYYGYIMAINALINKNVT
jgi:3-dehydroquinate dehydratase-2